MVTKRSTRPTKKVKSLKAKSLMSKQAKGVKGGKGPKGVFEIKDWSFGVANPMTIGSGGGTGEGSAPSVSEIITKGK